MAYRRSGSGSGSLRDPDFFKAALAGYEHERTVIVEKIAEVRRQLGGPAPSTNGIKPGRREMSAAARKRIADAQRKRWAAFRKEQAPATAKKTVGVQTAEARPMRRMSAAARKRISEATKKRWVAYRAKKTKAKKAA